MLSFTPQQLPTIIARAISPRRFKRDYETTFAVDHIASWRCAKYDPDLFAAGPVELVMGAHEAVRGISLKRIGWHGVYWRRTRCLYVLTFVFFCFTLTLRWCHTPNIEKVTQWPIAS